MKTSLVLCLSVVTMIYTIPLNAQPPPRRDRAPHHRPGAEADPSQMRKRIEDLRKVKLIDLLALDGTQVERFFTAYNRLQADVHASKDRMDQASLALWEATEKRDVSADALKKLTDDLLAKMQAFEQAVNVRHESLRSVLTPEQFAKYLAFEARFRDELMNMIVKRVRDRMD